MSPIELTDKQSGRLIEMCKALFVSDNNPYIDNNNNIIIWNLAKDIEAEFPTAFHWFEFCMTYLLKKICIKSESIEIYSNFISNFNCGSFKKLHPIDYLYEQFKQLKQQ